MSFLENSSQHEPVENQKEDSLEITQDQDTSKDRVVYNGTNVEKIESGNSASSPGNKISEKTREGNDVSPSNLTELLKSRSGKPRKLNPEELEQIILSLPDLLKTPVEAFIFSSERLIMTYSCVTAAGSLLPSVYGKYSNRRTHPALFLGVVAAPASNKGVVSYIRALLSKVHKHYRAESQRAKASFKVQLEIHKLAVKGGASSLTPPEPGHQSPIIAGDITGAKLIQQLQDNIGIPSIMIEDEIDSVANAMNSEHGQQLSKIFRNIFQHEPITQQLKGGNQHYEIEHSFMAMILAGTMSQLKKLIGNIENGLMSRYLLISVDDGPTWLKVGPCKECPDRDEMMTQFSERFYQFWEYFNGKTLEIRLTDEQWNRFDDFGKNQLSAQYNLHNEYMAAVVKRYPNMAFRICQVLTAIRFWENERSESHAVCLQEDFNLAMRLIEHSYCCSIEFFNQLPGGGKSSTAGAKEQFMASLPEKFTRAQAMIVAAALKIGTRNADNFLKHLTSGDLLLKVGFGEYKKIKPAKSANLQSDEEAGW